MLKDTRSQKQKFMDELGHQLQRRKLDTQQMNDGLLHVKWTEQKLCTVDSSGAVRFRAGDILDAEAEHQLQSVMHMAKGECLYKCGNERYDLLVTAPAYKEKLFGKAGGK